VTPQEIDRKVGGKAGRGIKEESEKEGRNALLVLNGLISRVGSNGGFALVLAGVEPPDES
jgi:hypothetical protein